MSNIDEISQMISTIDGKITDNAQTVASLQSEIQSLKGSQNSVSELENTIKSLQKEVQALQQTKAQSVITTDNKMDYGSRFVASNEFKAFKSALRDRNASIRLELAAAPETTQASNSATRTSLAQPYEAGIVTDPRQVLAIESLFGKINIDVNAYQYIKYGFTTTGTATGPAVVSEGSAKPESNYRGTIETGTIKTLAHWTKMTEQMIADNGNIVTFINDDMQYQLNKVIDAQIVNGTGSGQLKGLSASGNYTDYITGAGIDTGDTVIDLILKVKTKMEAANIRNISLLLNPVDWCKVLCSKNVNKDYLIPGIVDIPQQIIWGVPVILSGSVTSGKFHMGNFYEGGKIFERQGVTVEMARSGDDFEKNLMTLRVERRLDFAVVQPKALAYGDFSVS
ncbi:MAG: phage major capsid protein [Bacteroidales bacterium]|nr:phage major capsid protein [Bacteroidales bacterium]